MLTIATWNVNSIKSRMTHLLDYLRGEHSPDILLLQELKCTTDTFPYMELEDAGYNLAVHGQKTYNGVAILSKYPIDDVITSLPGNDNDGESRYIEGVVSLKNKAIRVASVYVPNGQSPDSEKFAYKLSFLDRLRHHSAKLLSYRELLVIGGDYNVAPELELDTFDPKGLNGSVCCHPDERLRFRSLTGLGLTDAYRAVHPRSQQYSWWDYRGGSWDHNKGLRIDHLLLSPEAADTLQECDVTVSLRALDKPSDHAPVWCRLSV